MLFIEYLYEISFFIKFLLRQLAQVHKFKGHLYIA